jgi:hypothetical protein
VTVPLPERLLFDERTIQAALLTAVQEHAGSVDRLMAPVPPAAEKDWEAVERE